MYEESAGMTPVRSGSYFDGIPALPKDAAVTMAYVPYQLNTARYSDDEALCSGTLYTDLNKPFLRGAVK